MEIEPGEFIALVGPSGCGKSTVARTVMGLLRPSAGEIHYDGERIDHLDSKALLPFRQRMQMIFQDPFASLSPRMSVFQIVEEGLKIHDLMPDADERRGDSY